MTSQTDVQLCILQENTLPMHFALISMSRPLLSTQNSVSFSNWKSEHMSHVYSVCVKMRTCNILR